MGSVSQMAATVSNVMSRRVIARSSFCSSIRAPTRRVTAASLGGEADQKTAWGAVFPPNPMTLVRRLISVLTHSSEFVEWNFAQWSRGKVV